MAQGSAAGPVGSASGAGTRALLYSVFSLMEINFFDFYLFFDIFIFAVLLCFYVFVHLKKKEIGLSLENHSQRVSMEKSRFCSLLHCCPALTPCCWDMRARALLVTEQATKQGSRFQPLHAALLWETINYFIFIFFQYGCKRNLR